MYDKIIPLGYNCNVTFLLGHNNLKKESSLFEWFETKSFSDIIDVIEKLSTIYHEIENHNIDIIPKRHRKGVIIEKDSIYSAHYNTNNYREIFNRRCKRFFNDIVNSKILLFIRVKCDNNLNDELVSRFEKIIKSINPNIEKINLLIIDDIKYKNKNNNNKDNNIIIKRYIDLKHNKNTFKYFEQNIDAINNFSLIMEEFGYSKNISKYNRNDKE